MANLNLDHFMPFFSFFHFFPKMKGKKVFKLVITVHGRSTLTLGYLRSLLSFGIERVLSSHFNSQCVVTTAK